MQSASQAPDNKAKPTQHLRINDSQLSEDEFYHNESLNVSKQVKNDASNQPQIKSALQVQAKVGNNSLAPDGANIQSTKSKHPIQIITPNS